MKERGPRYIMVLGRIVIVEESVSRGDVLAGGFGTFLPGETFNPRFLCPIEQTTTAHELLDIRQTSRERKRRRKETLGCSPRKDRDFEDAIHIGRFAHRPLIRQDFVSITKTLWRTNDLAQNFYRVTTSLRSSYVRDSFASLSDDEKDFYLSPQPCLLPLRDDETFHVEPYIPLKFARQLGYDQGVLELLVTIFHETQEIGVGTSSWYSLFSRFREISFGCDKLFSDPEWIVQASYDYAFWYSCTALKVVCRQLSDQQVYAFKPWDLSLPHYYRSDHGQGVMMGAESNFDDDVLVEEVIYAVEGSRFSPLAGITQEFALPLALCRHPISASKHRPSKIVSGSQVRSAGGGGSAGSIGEVSSTVGRATSSITLISESVSVATVARSRGSLGHINIPLLTVSNLFFSRGDVGDLNIYNVDRPLGLLDADDPILSDSFFAFAFAERAERSPPSLHRASLSRDRGMSELEGPVHQRLSFTGDTAGSDRKSVDAMFRNEAEPVAFGEGVAAEAVVPDTNGSGNNSLVGQHAPIGDADNHQNVVREGSCRLQKPLRPSKQGCFTRSFSSFWEEFARGLNEVEGPDDFYFLLYLCNSLKQSAERVEVELVGLLALVQLLTGFRNY
ncbi:hypothetical protein ACLOJK_034422 [Asimina triloba]